MMTRTVPEFQQPRPKPEGMAETTPAPETRADLRRFASDKTRTLKGFAVFAADSSRMSTEGILRELEQEPEIAEEPEMARALDNLNNKLSANSQEINDVISETEMIARSIIESEDRELSFIEIKKVIGKKAEEFVEFIEALPQSAKEDVELITETFLNFEKKLKRDPDYQKLIGKIAKDAIDELSYTAGEYFAGALKKLSAETQISILNSLMNRVSQGADGSRFALGALTELRLPQKIKQKLLLKAADRGGIEPFTRFQDLFSEAGVEQVAAAIVTLRDSPRDAAIILGNLTNDEQQKTLETLAEINPITLFRAIPALQISSERRLELAYISAENFPSYTAQNIDELHLTDGDKLALVFRLAHRAPNSFFKFKEILKIKLTEGEEMAIIQDILEKNMTLMYEAAETLRVPSHMVIEIIASYPKSERAKILEVLAIPTKSGETPKLQLVLAETHAEKIVGAVKRSPGVHETKADKELIHKLETASRALLSEILQAYPERAVREHDRSRAEDELRGSMEPIKELGESANRPLAMSFERRVMPAIYKPKKRERQCREGIPPGTFAGREWLAFQIDRALQLDIVPVTIVRDGPDGIGAVQDWRIGRVALLADWQGRARQDDLILVGFFDAIVQNSDRHILNFLIEPDGGVQAIDNGSILGRKINRLDGIRSAPLDHVKGQPIPPSIRHRIQKFYESPGVIKALRQAFEAALGDEAETAWREFLERMDKILTSGVLPKSDWLFLETTTV